MTRELLDFVWDRWGWLAAGAFVVTFIIVTLTRGPLEDYLDEDDED